MNPQPCILPASYQMTAFVKIFINFENLNDETAVWLYKKMSRIRWWMTMVEFIQFTTMAAKTDVIFLQISIKLQLDKRQQIYLFLAAGSVLQRLLIVVGTGYLFFSFCLSIELRGLPFSFCASCDENVNTYITTITYDKARSKLFF